MPRCKECLYAEEYQGETVCWLFTDDELYIVNDIMDWNCEDFERREDGLNWQTGRD